MKLLSLFGLLIFALSARAQVVTYNEIQQTAGWKPPQVGSNIGGGAASVNEWIQHVPASPTAVLMRTTGCAATCDWLAGANPPLALPSTFQGNVVFSFVITVGDTYAQCMHAFESDTKIAVGGYMYDGSSQNKAGVIQIDDAKPSWIDAGIAAPIFTPNVAHAVSYTYFVNQKLHTLSVVSYTQDGVTMPVPLSRQNVSGKPTNWKQPALYPQFQQDATCEVETTIDHVDYFVQ